MIKFSTKYLDKKINIKQIFEDYTPKIEKIHNSINDKKIPGVEMLGWLDYPEKISNKIIKEIDGYAKSFIKRDIKNLLIIAIGGSYNALRASIDMCIPPFNRKINVYYAFSLSSNYLDSLKNLLKEEDFFIVVISKSGKTIEPSIALRIFYEVLLKKYGAEEANSRVVAITSETEGSLIEISKKYRWKLFYIPLNIGGRFSALTPVSLVPMALLGLDISNVIKGAKKAQKDCSNHNIIKNSSYQYAVLRHYLHTKKKKHVEIFGSYEEEFFYFLEHLKQIFGESEGKDGKGLMPTIARFTTDLHSIGQFLQEGSPIFFETILSVKKLNNNLEIMSFFDNKDNLDRILTRKISDINFLACKSTMEAHLLDGGNSSLQIIVEELNEETFGYIYYWFSKAVLMSSLLLKVNPFDQPGVEAYKKRLITNIAKK